MLTKEVFESVLSEEGYDKQTIEELWGNKPHANLNPTDEELRSWAKRIKPLIARQPPIEECFAPPLLFLLLVSKVRPDLAQAELWTQEAMDRILDNKACDFICSVASGVTDRDQMIGAIGTAYVLGFYVGKGN